MLRDYENVVVMEFIVNKFNQSISVVYSDVYLFINIVLLVDCYIYY